MSRRLRLVYFVLAVSTLVVIGRIGTGSYAFLTSQFWFTSGLFLAILLSLVDQPHFSKDANVFVNAVTGWVALLTVPLTGRDDIWWFFLLWTCYLIVSGGFLIWTRVRELDAEHPLIQAISRLNREIGKPMTLFSAFFLWGLFRQFEMPSKQFDSLLLFWVVFFLLNVPSVARIVDQWLTSRLDPSVPAATGLLTSIVSPSVAEARFYLGSPNDLVGKPAALRLRNGGLVADGIVMEDRIVAGDRVGRIALTDFGEHWTAISDEERPAVVVEVDADAEVSADSPIGVVETGSDIGMLTFSVAPSRAMQVGEVVSALTPTAQSFYQVIGAKVEQQSTDGGNAIQRVRVTTGQLGVWGPSGCRFEPTTWVARAGSTVKPASGLAIDQTKIPKTNEVVGLVPNSDFPIHVKIDDIVTHNTAILGVTGSGKSYLAFHLIEAMVKQGIKVLVLDISRQHYSHLQGMKPAQLKTPDDVPGWLDSEAKLGIHQLALAAGFPKITADFVEKTFSHESQKVKLSPGQNEPARLCIVLEEAHSLIPEWNQVAQDQDKGHVNKTARIILQGRKFGMGVLLVTQRTANVTKTILNQCNTIFALQSFDQTGLDFLKNYMGEDYAHALSTLLPRQAILVGKASSSTRPVIVNVTNFADRWAQKHAPIDSESPAKVAEPLPVDSSKGGA